METYTQQQSLATPLPVAEVVVIAKRRHLEMWELAIALLLIALLAATTTMVATGYGRNDAVALPPVALPVAAPVESQPASPASVQPATWAWESDSHTGAVPGYTTPPQGTGADTGPMNPESGQSMTGVIFP